MSNFWTLLSRIRAYPNYTFWGVFFHVLTAVLTVISIPLVIPFFQILFEAEIVDSTVTMWDLEGRLNSWFGSLIVDHGAHGALLIVCLMVVVVFALKNLCRFMISYFMIPVRNGVLRDLRSKIWDSYEALSLAQRYDKKQGYLLSLITNDLSEVDHGILKVFELLFKTPLIVLGSFLMMLWLSPKLTLIAFALILFTVLVVGVVSNVLKRQSAHAQTALSGISELADEYLGSFRAVKSFNAGSYFRRLFDRENEKYYQVTKKMLRRRDLASPLAEFLGVLTVVLLLYAGAQQVLSDELQASTFFAFIFAFYNIIDPAKSFSREYANVQRGLAALERIDGFIGQGSSAPDESHQVLRVGKAELVFDRVSFSYQEEVSVISDLSLQLGGGRTIGIVGYSGQGKTTILDLMLRFYRPQGGLISIDGIDIQDIREEEYRSLFGLVGQQPALFYGTVRDNILLGAELDEERLSRIIKDANLTADMLDKKVGDRGTQLSGGEGQRIAIARALYRSPQILLLDEPTSNLDRKNEAEVIASILMTIKDRSVVMITHNIQLLRSLDHIIVLDRGKAEAQGNYDFLCDNSDVFSSLILKG